LSPWAQGYFLLLHPFLKLCVYLRGFAAAEDAELSALPEASGGEMAGKPLGLLSGSGGMLTLRELLESF